MRRPLLLAVAATAVLASGCGEREPSDEEQVRSVLRTFARAAEARDYGRICGEVFAPKLLSGLQSIGLPCEVAMRNSLGEVRNPRLTVGRVTVQGRTATAEVRTAAEGQDPSSDQVRLQKVKAGWRISDLSAAARGG